MLTTEATAAAEQLARDLGVDVATAVLRACNAALMLRWLVLDAGAMVRREPTDPRA